FFSQVSDLRLAYADSKSISGLCFFSTARRHPTRPKPVDIGDRARQLQTKRLCTYALAFSCVAGFIVIVLNNFQEMVFYVTQTDAMEQYKANPKNTKFRLGGLVLEGSVVQLSNSWLIQFSFHYFLHILDLTSALISFHRLWRRIRFHRRC
ncbi:Cytochrome c-type biogenesis protein CcmE homolog, mitochondrial, partial [Linum perenne]